MDIQIISAFILYFCALTGIGIFFYQRSKNASDFMLGNRSVNYWVTAVATQASDMGAWLFLGLPALVFARGLSAYWSAIGLIVFMFLTWHYIAPKLRLQTGKLQSLTLSSYFEQHFADTTGAIRLASALFTLFFFIFYIASGLVGLGLLFESAFNITYHNGIMISLLTACLYTLIGGFVAVAWCDFFQGVFLLVMIILVPTYAFFTLDGVHEIITTAHANGISLSLLSSPADMLNALLLAAGWGLGYFGQPHILVNFMGIDDPKKVKYAKRIGMTWLVLALTASASIGLVGIAFFKQGLANNELLFILMTKALFHPLLAGFILCAIIAGTLSTMDSHILISGSTLAEDLYKKILNHRATQQQIVWISRLGSIAVALAALSIAWNKNASVYELVNYAWSGLGSSFGPLVIASLYWPKTTRFAALAGLIIGGTTSAIWPYLNTGILPLVPGFFASMTTIFILSYLQPNKRY